MVEDALLERLTGLLRRDPTDREVAFLVSLAARRPERLYDSERHRLQRMVLTSASGERARLLADVARWMLEHVSQR